MIVLITGALVETLTKYMFNKYLDSLDRIDIGGAPSWYMKPVDDEMCVFTHKTGNMDTIDFVKEKARLKMIKKIDDTIDIVIYENIKNITNTKEKAVVDKWKIDSNLPVFVNKNLHYTRISYEDEINAVFARGCIPKKVFIDYQTDRLKSIKKEVLKYKSNTLIKEMENDLLGKKSNKNSNDPFSELE